MGNENEWYWLARFCIVTTFLAASNLIMTLILSRWIDSIIYGIIVFMSFVAIFFALCGGKSRRFLHLLALMAIIEIIALLSQALLPHVNAVYDSECADCTGWRGALILFITTLDAILVAFLCISFFHIRQLRIMEYKRK